MAESLIARVDRLEAEVASLKGSLIGIVNEAVSAMGFELLNSDAEVVAELKTTEQDEPYFALLDKDHTARFIVHLEGGSPQLLIRDQDGNDRVSLAIRPDDSLGLVMTGQYRRNRIILGFGRNASPYLQIAGTDGVIDLDTSFEPGWLGLSLGDESGKYRLTAALDPSDHNGRPFIVLTDHRGQQRWWRGG